MTKHHYYELAGFQNVYLEDSFVFEIHESVSKFVLHMEVVLNEQHPFYTSPKSSEQYCYKKAAIIFTDVETVEWEEKNFKRYPDANGEYDYGNIDTFYLVDGYYYLAGDWGRVKIKATGINLNFQHP